MQKPADIAMEHAVGPSGMGMDTGSRPYPTHEEIARLAFDFYESRGREDGHEVEDWLRAEEELRQRVFATT